MVQTSRALGNELKTFLCLDGGEDASQLSPVQLKERLEKLSKILECNICLGQMTNPKTLQCSHAFCKSCLDNVIQWCGDGSGVIVCPLRCEAPTIIAKDATTDQLTVPVQFRNFMEMFEDIGDGSEKKGKWSQCVGRQGCKRSVNYYCLSCSSPLCESCWENHLKKYTKHAKHCFPARIHDDELQPWCTTHQTVCLFACDRCKFACIYCRHRGCKEHVLADIAPTAIKVVEYVRNNEPNWTQENAKLKLIRANTERALEEIRKKIHTEFDYRKIRCIAIKLEELEKREQMVIDQVDAAAVEHYKLYPQTELKELIAERPGFDLVHNREVIIKNLTETAAKQVIQYTEWRLDEDDDIVECELPPAIIKDSFCSSTIEDKIKIGKEPTADKKFVHEAIEKIYGMVLKKKEEPKKERPKTPPPPPKPERKYDHPKFKPVTTSVQRYTNFFL